MKEKFLKIKEKSKIIYIKAVEYIRNINKIFGYFLVFYFVIPLITFCFVWIKEKSFPLAYNFTGDQWAVLIGGIFAYIGTITLGMIAIDQNNNLKMQNARLLDIQDENNLISHRNSLLDIYKHLLKIIEDFLNYKFQQPTKDDLDFDPEKFFLIHKDFTINCWIATEQLEKVITNVFINLHYNNTNKAMSMWMKVITNLSDVKNKLNYDMVNISIMNKEDVIKKINEIIMFKKTSQEKYDRIIEQINKVTNIKASKIIDKKIKA